MGAHNCCLNQSRESLSLKQKKNKNLLRQIYNQLTLEINQGSVQYDPVQAIVLVANERFQFTCPLTQKIIDAGGFKLSNTIQNAQQENQVVENGQIIQVETTMKKYKFIFFAILPEEDKSYTHHQEECHELLTQIKNLNLDDSLHISLQKQYVYECVINALHLANQLGVTSISFPVLDSTKKRNSQTDTQIATIMILAIKDFAKEKQMSNLNLISLCIKVFNIFYEQSYESANIFLWTFQRILSGTSVDQHGENELQQKESSRNSYYSSILNQESVWKSQNLIKGTSISGQGQSI